MNFLFIFVQLIFFFFFQEKNSLQEVKQFSKIPCR